MERPRLLVVDDDEDLRTQMRWALTDDYDVLLASDRRQALDAVREHRPGLVTLDLGLPPEPQGVGEGFAALADIQAINPDTRVVVITGREEREYALQAVAQGASDYFVKPIDVAELKVVLRRARQLLELERENRERTPEQVGFEDIVGRSPLMEDVFAVLRKVAPSDATVLVTGESGTGKELVARALHHLSPRRAGPFVAINCGAIPEALLESELFGHEKGAYTGAHAQRKGRIEAAHGGVLLLDEIGELPQALQVKLLRFLQERKVERLGGRAPIPVDARLIAATNADLEQLMAENRFREDLFYRISVVKVVLPPLRQRGEDVLLLANTFLRRFASETPRRLQGFTREALAVIQAHEWPGNVRELENRVRRAVLMAEGSRVTPADLDLAASTSRPSLRERRLGVDRDVLQEALARNRWNVSQTAAELNISRPTLYSLMEKLGIRRD